MPGITEVEETGNFTSLVVLRIIILLVGLVVINAFNIISTIGFEASIFQSMAFVGTIGIIFAAIIRFVKKGKEGGNEFDFNVPIVEQPIIPISTRVILIISAVTGILVFLFVSFVPLKVAAPSFSVNLGFNGDFTLNFFAALFENTVFFSLIPGIILSTLYFIIRAKRGEDIGLFPKILIFGVTVGITTFSVWFYHLNVYGYGDVVGQTAVIGFAIFGTVMTLLLRNIFFMDAYHVGNNLGLLVAKKIGLSGFFIGIFSNIFTYVVIVLAIVFILLRRRAGKGGK